jgi:hypothetical protein
MSDRDDWGFGSLGARDDSRGLGKDANFGFAASGHHAEEIEAVA